MPLANFSFATMSYNEADEGGENNALHIAAKEGNLAEVQSQVSNFDINVKGEDGVTALYLAANNGSIKVVELLLALDADVNIPNVSTLKNDIYPSDMYFPHIFPTLPHII